MKARPTFQRSLLLRGLFCLCIIGSAVSLPAQDSREGEDEDVVSLSPFEVSTDEDVGYLAANTLAGSRLDTSLKDTPAAISVLTAEFLSDLGAQRLEEALRYAVNVEFELDDSRANINGNATFQDYQTYRVRGLDASRSRNYFSWNGPMPSAESAFVERIEESRGPNSVLFGIAAPGGLININTKQARFERAFQTVSFSVGSFASWRTTLDVNRPLLDGKLAIRFNGVFNKDNEFRHHEFQEHLRGHLAATYKFTDRTRIRAEFERGQIDSNKGRSFSLLNRFLRWHENGRPTFDTPAANEDLGIERLSNNANQRRVTYISNNDTTISMRGAMVTTGDAPLSPQFAATGPEDALIRDRSIADYSINVGGPAQNRYSRYGIFSTFFEHQLAGNTFLELGYNYLEHSFDNRDPRGDSANALKGDPNNFQNDGSPNPFAGDVYLETNWFKTIRWDKVHTGRVTLSHELDAGKWGRYRLAALGEYQDSFVRSTTYRELWVDPDTGLPVLNAGDPDNAQNNVWRRSYPVEGDWDTYSISGPLGSGGLLSNVTDPVTGLTLSSAWLRQNYPRESYSIQRTGMLALQARYFEERLVATLGFRRDEIDEHELARWTDPVTGLRDIAPDPSLADNNQEEQFSEDTGRTKTLGLVYHISPQLSIFYNYSDNIALPARGQTILPPSGEPGDPLQTLPPEGEGEDFGLALDLFGGRVYARATYYTTEGKDQSTTSPARIRNQANRPIMDALLSQGLISEEEHSRRLEVGGHGLFDHASKGVELQIVANATRDWRFILNAAKTDAVETNKFVEWKNWVALTDEFLSQFDTDSIVTEDGDTVTDLIQLYHDEIEFQTEANGLGKLGNRRYRVNFFTRYNFSSGPLKGAYIGGGYQYNSRMFAGLDADEDISYTNSYWRADLLAGYSVQLPRERRLNFQLNIYNLFDDQDPLVTRLADDGVTVFREVVQPPITWRLTTTYEF
ncbi:MAG: TonB-dependent siderophore receptor [Opitutaceae bacterium]